MVKTDYIKLSDIEQWFIATIIGDEFDKMQNYDGTLEIQVLLNGVEFDFSNIVNAVNEVFENAVKEYATGKLEDESERKISSIISDLYHIEQQVKQLKNDLQREVKF